MKRLNAFLSVALWHQQLFNSKFDVNFHGFVVVMNVNIKGLLL